MESLNFQLQLDLEGTPLTDEQKKRLTQNIVNAICREAENFGITPDEAEDTSASFIVLRQVETDHTVRASISNY